MQTARKVPVNPNNFRRRMKILTKFYLFFLILDISKLQSCWKVVVSIKLHVLFFWQQSPTQAPGTVENNYKTPSLHVF